MDWLKCGENEYFAIFDCQMPTMRRIVNGFGWDLDFDDDDEEEEDLNAYETKETSEITLNPGTSYIGVQLEDGGFNLDSDTSMWANFSTKAYHDLLSMFATFCEKLTSLEAVHSSLFPSILF